GGAFRRSRQVDRVCFDRDRPGGARHLVGGHRDGPVEVVVGPKLCNDLPRRGHAHRGRSVEIAKRRLPSEGNPHGPGGSLDPEERSLAGPAPPLTGHWSYLAVLPCL